MKAIAEWILSIWNNYWGGGFYQYLLLVSAVYLLIFHRKERGVRQALAFSFALLFVFAFPPTALVIRACIGADVYWRVLWLLPTIPVIALAAAEFLRGVRSRLLQTVLLAACVAVIALSGTDMFGAGNFIVTQNRQKVPDEVAQVCNLVLDAAARDNLDEIRMASDDHVSAYARVYDASIGQPYGRWGMGAEDTLSKRIFRLMNRAEPRNYRRIARLSKKNGCNFLVIVVPDDREKARIERYGYTEIGTVSSYSVFQLKD